MKGFLLGLTKLLLGLFFALMLLSLASVAAARYFMAKLAVLPDRPTFENDVALVADVETDPAEATGETEAEAEAQAPPTEPETPIADPALEPGAYSAMVTQPIGLVLRDGPGTQYNQMGGIENNERMVVLEESEDRQWLRVRIPSTSQEGWVRAGNSRRLEDEAAPTESPNSNPADAAVNPAEMPFVSGDGQ
jgi:uncharacterized protein YgiM (DUF1202 family)